MVILENLKPEKVFKYFEELSSIPRGSGNTKQASDWLVEFAKSRNLEYYQDELNDVIIIKNATKGYENSDAVILQGHIDMVCEKEHTCLKDMDREGIDLALDGDVISAKGTTLGADNGIAVAMMLAILDSDEISHPRIECVFTVDEETGLYGASFIDVSPLKGKSLINIDSEDEGVFTVSCAGGNVTKCILPITRGEFKGEALRIKISGLTGGHSGIEINKGRANSNILMGRLLFALEQKVELRVITVNGGLKNNAIPVESVAEIVVPDEENCMETVKEFNEIFVNEYRSTENTLSIQVEKCDYNTPMTKEDSGKTICMLMCIPDGVICMSNEIKDLVQTSLNLGIFSVDETSASAELCVRSSVDSQKEMLSEKLACFMKSIGGKTEISGDYSGWDFNENSPMRNLMTEVFKEQYGHEPKIEAIHAGLECGVFAGKIKNLDCISIGPDLRDVHTPREKLYVSSVARVWDMLIETLKRMK